MMKRKQIALSTVCWDSLFRKDDKIDISFIRHELEYELDWYFIFHSIYRLLHEQTKEKRGYEQGN